nr:hypothetical protein [Gammaproteobacteria bacterium]
MTQLELSYDDCPELPPLPGTERTEPELDATGRQCLAFIDRNLVDQPAANDVVHAEQAGDSAGNSQTDGSRLTTPRLALLRTSDGAQSELCTLLADAGIEVFPLDVADGQPAFVLPDEYDLALIDFTDAEWAKRRVQSWQRHPQAAGRAILAHGYATASERCQLLEAGAADVLDTRLDPRELVLRCLHTIDRQRAQEARLERLVREKNLTAYPSAQITGVGNTLFATAQRGHISLVVAVLCLTEAATTRVPDVAQMIRCC